MPETKHFVYLLQCENGAFYTGWTTDLIKRVNCHNRGKGAKYTRAHLPVSLVYYEEFVDKSDALSREIAIKKLSHEEKKKLAQSAQKDEKAICFSNM